jgi:membrane-associated phospholipid phosphatase
MTVVMGPASAGSLDSTAVPQPPAQGLFGRRDLVFLAATAGAMAFAARNDVWLTDETTEAHSAGEDRLAALAQPLGNPIGLLPILALSYGAARWTGHPEAARAMVRVGASIVAAGGVSLALKEAFGRPRPSQSPNDADDFHPFTGGVSFPSGHATIAFAAAAAVDRETRSRWVPLVVYPMASVLAWSRVHDRHHWTSDVVAGAAIGGWTAWKTDSWLIARHGRESRMSLELLPGPAGRVTLRF